MFCFPSLSRCLAQFLYPSLCALNWNIASACAFTAVHLEGSYPQKRGYDFRDLVHLWFRCSQCEPRTEAHAFIIKTHVKDGACKVEGLGSGPTRTPLCHMDLVTLKKEKLWPLFLIPFKDCPVLNSICSRAIGLPFLWYIPHFDHSHK